MRQLKSRKGVEYFPCVGDPAEGKRFEVEGRIGAADMLCRCKSELRWIERGTGESGLGSP